MDLTESLDNTDNDLLEQWYIYEKRYPVILQTKKTIRREAAKFILYFWGLLCKKTVVQVDGKNILYIM